MKITTKHIMFSVLILVNVESLFSQSKFLKEFKLQSSKSESPLPLSNSISQIAIQDTSFELGTAKNLWLGTSKGVARSTNQGRSWEGFGENSAFANRGIFALAVRHDTIWAATGYEHELSEGSVQTGSGYTFSTDGGLTWNHLGQVIDQRSDSIISYCIDDSTCLNDSIWILPIVVPQQNVTFDISFSPGTVWIASWASGLRMRHFSDTTWHRILLPPDTKNSIKPTDTLWTYSPADTFHTRRIFPRFDPRQNNNFLAFSVYAQGNDTIWCGTAGGVNKSTDGGKSWTRFSHQNQASPILGNWVIAIDMQRLGTTERLWTTNWKAEDPDEQYGVSFTDDGGRTWTNILHDVKAYEFAFKDSITYIATDEGLYRTADGGNTFIKITSIVDPTTRQVIASSSIYSIGVIDDTVFVGTGDGLASTVDNDLTPFGSSWKIYRTYQQLGNTSTTYVYPNPFSPAFEPVRIHYGTASATSISIDIFDFGMNRVRTLVNKATRQSNSEFDELWDGRDDDGRLVANGVYFYRVQLDDYEPMYGKILVLQ
jgi:hypothetical protein